MTTTNYSSHQSHERRMSPQEASMALRSETLKTSVDYLHAVVAYTDPEALQTPSAHTTGSADVNMLLRNSGQTSAAGSANVSMSPRMPGQTPAANIIAFTGQEQLLADARRRASEEAL